MDEPVIDLNIERVMQLGERIQYERATPADAIEWLELVSNGNKVRDMAVQLIKDALTTPDKAEIEGKINDLIENVRLEGKKGIEGLWPAEPRTEYLKAALLKVMGVE